MFIHVYVHIHTYNYQDEVSEKQTLSYNYIFLIMYMYMYVCNAHVHVYFLSTHVHIYKYMSIHCYCCCNCISSMTWMKVGKQINIQSFIKVGKQTNICTCFISVAITVPWLAIEIFKSGLFLHNKYKSCSYCLVLATITVTEAASNTASKFLKHTHNNY